MAIQLAMALNENINYNNKLVETYYTHQQGLLYRYACVPVECIMIKTICRVKYVTVIRYDIIIIHRFQGNNA